LRLASVLPQFHRCLGSPVTRELTHTKGHAMSKTGLFAALLIVSFAPAALAQAPAKPDQSAIRAKKDACRAEAKAKNITEKTQRKAFMTDCTSKK
jgi:hypothetical protein